MRTPAAEVAVAVVGPTARAIRWTVPAIMAGVALALVRWKYDTFTVPLTALTVVRVVVLLLIVGTLAVFDDPAALQVASAPVPLSWRMAPRILFALGIVLVPVALLATIAGVPPGAVSLEAGALLALATAACLLLARGGILEPSLPVAVGLLLAPPALFLLPERLALIVEAGPNWAPAHARWGILLGLGLALTALAVRDPARRW